MNSVVLATICIIGFSQTGDTVTTEELMAMDLESLLNTKVVVATASREGTSLNQAPGIISVITRDQLVATGARDLFEALLLVPGLHFGADVLGQIGLGVRGNWANEGKALLLIDGVEMNERMYGTIQFGNHYRVENVDRIEIIRGPGSALYGGTAELAVINVVTRDAAAIGGLGVQAQVSLMDEHFGGVGAHAAIGGRAGATDLTASGGYEFRNRSTRDYTNLHGDGYSLLSDADLQSIHANLGVRWKGLDARVIVDRYSQVEQDGFEYLYSLPDTVVFETYAFKGGYDWDIRDNLVLTPWASLQFQRPFYESFIDDTTATQLPYDKRAFTVRGGLRLSIHIARRLNILAGLEGIYDNATSKVVEEFGDPDYFRFYNGTYSFSQGLAAGFAQALVDLKPVSITIGGRGQYSPDFGWAFAPRGALNLSLGKAHLKLLGSGAYKSPTIENVNGNENARATGHDIERIRPEQTWVAELEAGVDITRNVSLAANGFISRIDDPIMYFYEFAEDSLSGDVEGYANFERTGTAGVEALVQTAFPLWWSSLSYSFQQAYRNEAVTYEIVGDDGTMVGWPAHKVTIAAGVSLLDKRLTLGPSLVWFSKRFAYTGVEYDDLDTTGATYWSTGEWLDPVTLVNLNASYNFAFGLRVALGVFNILDDPMMLAQPYDGYHGPVSSSSRTFRLTLGYDMRWKKS